MPYNRTINMSYPPSMVHKSGNQLVVRSVVSGNQLFGSPESEERVDCPNTFVSKSQTDDSVIDNSMTEQDEVLPQCKVKRNYACSTCSYYTQNPRYYLHHLKNVHKEKIRIYECPHCLYASKHSQKLQRHVHMVHVMGKRKMVIKAKTASVPESVIPVKDVCNEVDVEVERKIEEGKSIWTHHNQLETPAETTPSSAAITEAVAEEGEDEEEDEEEGANDGENQSDQPVKCSLCSFSSRNHNLVTRHERLVHLKKKFYRCTKCDYITHMKARFTKHVKYHSMPMIKCEMCDFRTPYKWNLDRHNKNHFANGAFKCSLCNFTADIKQSLTVHEMNHHVPPINQNGGGGTAMPTPAKRRCRVGASDIINQQETSTTDPDLDELELLRMERESLPTPSSSLPVDDGEDQAMVVPEENSEMTAVEITMVKPNTTAPLTVVPSGGAVSKTLILRNSTAAAYVNGTLKPEDVILMKNGNVYVKKFKCRVCQYKAAWESEMIRHELRVHSIDSSSPLAASASAKKKTAPRPIPNLIPIQNNSPSTPSSVTSIPLSNPTANSLVNRMKPQVKSATPLSSSKNGFVQTSSHLAELEFEKPLTEKDLNDIYAKSCATSSLKDFASLIGADESTIKSDKFKDFMSRFTYEQVAEKKGVEGQQQRKLDYVDSSVVEKGDNKKIPEVSKKKNSSFFDKLKEKLMVGSGEIHNLVCWCGYKSKCLSESVLHQKTHSDSSNEKNDKSVSSGLHISGAELSSTRCQHCRQRCKTSSDLFVHLQSCSEIIRRRQEVTSANDPQEFNERAELNGIECTNNDEESEFADDRGIEVEKGENKVFVWNNFAQDKDETEEYSEDDFRSKSPASESSLVGYEIAPGIGSVMASNNSEETNENLKDYNIDVHNVETTTKKVFKCPTCTFWASTASRFHVHIVSHMNVKPFGCSVCPYQSKWKWDVTKHIKLKKERDPTHEGAEMQTIDMETGRRNYTKYNRFLTVMRVHEPRLDLSTTSPATPAKVAASSPNLQLLVPLLPKLTPAPTINGDVPNSSESQESDVTMRPLPQLHPANPNVALKRPHETVGVEEGETPKKKVPSEKKMWKCKKCKFRNTDRNIVLAHVKEHYYTNGPRNSNTAGTDSEIWENRTSGKEVIKCDLCNFETDCQSTFRVHSSHHVEDTSATFKCCFCPFFANDKQFLINHISSHGVKNPEESLPTIMNSDESTKPEEDEKMDTFVNDQSMSEMSDMSTNKSDSCVGGDEMEIYKRFKCCSCPYVTNNKSQYLYHKQFHKLRGAPFKCNICSYNVSKRHLLHQHLKIHGVQRAQFKNCLKDAVEKDLSDEECFTLITDLQTATMSDIPSVWVHKAGTLTKMFKCRHCPHVNLRKSNISEHEKMHFDRVMRSPNGSITGNQASTHHCSGCNYVCNNAGALASHFKVHQGAFGHICALADPRRSDESQIREITRMLKEDERFKKYSLHKKDETTTTEARSNTAVVGSNGASSSEPQSAADKNPPTSEENKVLHFCNVCPARFLFLKDLESHSRFHSAHHVFKCNSCSYSAPQQAQLMAHKRVHMNEYQEKTNIMIQMYEMSMEFARPKATFISDKPGFAGLGWVVMHTSQKKDELTSNGGPKSKTVTKQFSCHKCPAQFFKSVALQHHLTLHGGKDQYQCRGCDYRVKTYGNLIKHEAVHGLEPRLKAKVIKKKLSNGDLFPHQIAANASLPSSGPEPLQHRTDQIINEPETLIPPISTPTVPSASSGLSVDPEFGIFIHGSPDFIYPQTVKNGKLKEKRYKCHKCPSAFEKREQYKTHLSLHGAKSRFRCLKCDYAVKYFANYTQHMRKHDLNEKCQMERRASIVSKTSKDLNHEKLADVPSPPPMTRIPLEECARPPSASSSPEKYPIESPLSTPYKAAKTLHISVADQQAIVFMQEKISQFGINVADQLHRCYYCPYSHMRKDAVESHERCHLNPKGSFICEFCNYTVPHPYFLREHQKLHFGLMKGLKPEAYMKCDRLEIWMETEEGKILIFKDSGRKENRFEPLIPISKDETIYKKIYVDVKTGEEFALSKNNAVVNDIKCQMSPVRIKSEPIFSSPSENLVEPVSVSSSPISFKDEESAMYEMNVESNEEQMTNDDDDVGGEHYVENEEATEDVELVEDYDEECDEENDEVEEAIEEDKEDDSNFTNTESDAEMYEDADTTVADQTDKGGEDTSVKNFTENLVEENVESVIKATKTLSDESDTEDSDSSSSSSSSSCSGSSCSSSDSSEEDDKEGNKDQAREPDTIIERYQRY